MAANEKGLATVPRTATDDGVLESIICEGNLAKLQPADRVKWYKMRCESVGLDPRTQPFQYIVLNGKLTLYATKTATEQLCEKRHITTEIRGRERMDDLYIVTCRAQTADGRFTDSIGAVSISGLKAENLANALMKAETKAKRRAVLSLCGLGMLDENEVADIPTRVPMHINVESGEVIEPEPQQPATVHEIKPAVQPEGEHDPQRKKLKAQVRDACTALGYDLKRKEQAMAKTVTMTNAEIVKALETLNKLIEKKECEALIGRIRAEFAEHGWDTPDDEAIYLQRLQMEGPLDKLKLDQLLVVADDLGVGNKAGGSESVAHDDRLRFH